jgi:hypothetical protein
MSNPPLYISKGERVKKSGEIKADLGILIQDQRKGGKSPIHES